MTNQQFDALLQMTNLRRAEVIEAARHHLVGGMTQANAMRATQVTRQDVHRAVKLINAMHDLAKQATNQLLQACEAGTAKRIGAK